jgi:hypothetical protein
MVGQCVLDAPCSLHWQLRLPTITMACAGRSENSHPEAQLSSAVLFQDCYSLAWLTRALVAAQAQD